MFGADVKRTIVEVRQPREQQPGKMPGNQDGAGPIAGAGSGPGGERRPSAPSGATGSKPAAWWNADKDSPQIQAILDANTRSGGNRAASDKAWKAIVANGGKNGAGMTPYGAVAVKGYPVEEFGPSVPEGFKLRAQQYGPGLSGKPLETELRRKEAAAIGEQTIKENARKAQSDAFAKRAAEEAKTEEDQQERMRQGLPPNAVANHGEQFGPPAPMTERQRQLTKLITTPLPPKKPEPAKAAPMSLEKMGDWYSSSKSDSRPSPAAPPAPIRFTPNGADPMDSFREYVAASTPRPAPTSNPSASNPPASKPVTSPLPSNSEEEERKKRLAAQSAKSTGTPALH